MKRTYSLIALLACLACANGAYSQVYQLHIIDAQKFKEPVMNWKNPNDVATYYAGLAVHKDHEVTVGHFSYGYKVNYFQKENDSMKEHAFIASESALYDRAEYIWNKDTLVVHFINANGKSKAYKGYGWGNSSSMKID